MYVLIRKRYKKITTTHNPTVEEINYGRIKFAPCRISERQLTQLGPDCRGNLPGPWLTSRLVLPGKLRSDSWETPGPASPLRLPCCLVSCGGRLRGASPRKSPRALFLQPPHFLPPLRVWSTSRPEAGVTVSNIDDYLWNAYFDTGISYTGNLPKAAHDSHGRPLHAE